VPEWADIRWPDGKPEDAHLVAPCCGAQVDHWQKGAMKLADGWLSDEIDGEKPPRVLTEEAFQEWRAKMPASRKRGFHLTGIISSFQTWADMATLRRRPGRREQAEDLDEPGAGLGLRTEPRRSRRRQAAALREQDWGRGQMPAGPVVTTMGVDVQGDGIYLEVVGHGPRRNLAAGRAVHRRRDRRPMQGAWADLDAYSPSAA
jgi:phage terminase large subunit GpA-like protein